jgi:hypothetical protein
MPASLIARLAPQQQWHVRRRRALPLLFSQLIRRCPFRARRALFSFQFAFSASIFWGPRCKCALFLFFSTVIHKFAQTFLRNFIDAENGKVYLRPQIEPEA